MKKLLVGLLAFTSASSYAAATCDKDAARKILNEASITIKSMSKGDSRMNLLAKIELTQVRLCDATTTCGALAGMFDAPCQQRLATSHLSNSEVVDAAKDFKPSIKTAENLLNRNKEGGACSVIFYGSSDVEFLGGFYEVVDSISECQKFFEKRTSSNAKKYQIDLNRISATISLDGIDGSAELSAEWNVTQKKWNYNSKH